MATAAAAGFASDRHQLFARFDRNGDGRVSAQEYRDYLAQGFRALDRNGDGVVSRAEQPGGQGRRDLAVTDYLTQIDARFVRQDADRNGWLDGAELAAPPR